MLGRSAGGQLALLAAYTPPPPPTLLIHGERDDLVSVVHSARLAAHLAPAGRPPLLIRLPGANHGTDFVLRGPGGQHEVGAVERFLAAVFR